MIDSHRWIWITALLLGGLLCFARADSLAVLDWCADWPIWATRWLIAWSVGNSRTWGVVVVFALITPSVAILLLVLGAVVGWRAGAL